MRLTQGLHRSLQQQPDAVATVFGDRARTFTEHAARVAGVAGGLRALGVAAGDRVGYLGTNSDHYLEYYLAVPWAGAVAVPVNSRWAAAEIAYSLRDSGTEVLIVDDGFVGLVEELRELVPGLRVVIHAGDGPGPAGAESFEDLARRAPAPEAECGGDALAAIFYTGGTTGFPKGVMLSHRNLVTNALGVLAARIFSPVPRFLHIAPMFHIADYSCTTAVYAAGGTNVVVPGADPAVVLQAIEHHRITDLGLIPVILGMLVDHPDRATYDLSSVRAMAYGGSSITVALLERARAALPGVRFAQLFGQTEAAPLLTLLAAEDHEDTARPELLRSAGRAMRHTEVRILDESGAELPRGVQGEIAGRGDNVMLGYWNRPEETAAALRDGWLRTGDAGAMDEYGYVYVLDRIKDMIISGGENVYSAEVENALASHPDVAACAVIGLPDEKWGERVHAVVVLRPGAAPTAEDLQAHARAQIAGYKVPRSVAFAEALPMSAAGKVLKRELRQAQAGSIA